MDILSHGHSTTSTAGETPSDVARLRAELSEFELGRYLLNNLGLNGQWTSYVLLYPERGSQTRLSSDGSPWVTWRPGCWSAVRSCWRRSSASVSCVG